MEGVGSRLGRASSRYGTPAVFSGPVRRWKKKWVQVSSPSLSYQNSQSQSLSNANNDNGGSRLFLCRWTPITAPSTTTVGATENSSSVEQEEPPRRKFRYTPISVLEEQKKLEIRNGEYEAVTETEKSIARGANVSLEIPGKLNSNEITEKETQDSDTKQLDLDLGLNSSS
ncbi:hypothetical protein L6164_029451 [Bauhinia variegata]|uniref:Uncharacterized protein n=1 Tax=Bauhinia variegata TaxID=167791 RepID=A0ACB9L9E3_BAUVA|nr:hypothetical protein L6164_029451 [Bauhinia variegata]